MIPKCAKYAKIARSVLLSHGNDFCVFAILAKSSQLELKIREI